MKHIAHSAPRSTARLSLSPQPAGISDLQGWCLGLLSIGLVALTLHFGHEPETRPATRRDDRKAEAHRGAVFELLQPPLTFSEPLTLTLSVFGCNGDGEMGNLFADGTRYREDSIAFASNDFPLGSIVTVKTPDGKSLTAPVRDRMARRFTGKRIDVTVKGWKKLTSRGYGLIRGVRVWRSK